MITDPTLTALLASAADDPSDEASIAALADRLTEVSPADRVEVLRRLVASVRQLEACRASVTHTFHGNPQTRVLTYESRMMAEERDAGHVDREVRNMRRNAAIALGAAIEEAHWYAVRFTSESRPDDLYHTSSWGRNCLRLVRRVDIAPLDGGTITDPS